LDSILKKKPEESADLIGLEGWPQLGCMTDRWSLTSKFVFTDYFHPISPAESERNRIWAEELYESGPRQRRRRWEARCAARREARALAKLVLELHWDRLFGSGEVLNLEEYDVVLTQE
jgi:hypothetical protein